MQSTSDALFSLDITYGHIELDQRIVPKGNAITFESRTRNISRDGVVGPWSEWTETGARMTFPTVEDPIKPWWRFW